MYLFKKIVKGRSYLIAATTERVAGKKHPVSRQVSLGPAETDEAFVPSLCVEAGFKRVGDIAALAAVAEELGVLEAFNAEAPRVGTGPTLGELVLAVALQRVCAPGAKRELPDFLDSCLPRFCTLRNALFTGQTFHRVTRAFTQESYDKVQLAIAAAACKSYRLKTDVLAYDTTNFDTFIDSTTKSSLARRGHAKSKRADLKVVGLALMTSSSGSVPLFHHPYAGNMSDKTVLANTLGTLAKLHIALGGTDRTLVRDGGFAGEQLELALAGGGYHSVSVLALSTKTSRDALARAVGKLELLSGKLSEIGAWRTRVTGDGLDRTLVVTESPELLRGQLRGLNQAVKKAKTELRKIAKRLGRERAGMAPGRHYTATALKRRIDKLVAREHVREVLRIDIGGTEQAPTLVVENDREGRTRLIRERLGKRVLVTDQHEWSTEQIVRAFRSQWKVERAFRRMKRGSVSPWGPSFQWTDDSLRAHTFATVLGLQLASLVRLKLQRAGVKHSTKGCLKMLAGIRLTRLSTPAKGLGAPREILVRPRLDLDAMKAVALFDIGRWTSLVSTTPREGPRPRGAPSARPSTPSAVRK